MITTGGLNGLAFLVIVHGKGFAIFALGWLAFAILLTIAYHVLKRVYMRRITDVWGDYVTETPEILNDDDKALTEEAHPMPPATAVSCPTCKAAKLTLCVTTSSELPMPICHISRAAKFERRLSHRRNTLDALGGA